MSPQEEQDILEQIESGPVHMRPQLLGLVRAMEIKLARNDHKRAWDTFGKSEAYWFLTKLRGEVDELQEAMLKGTATEIMLEAADVANFALFIFDLVRREGAIGEP